jgi:hypothetical protein
MIASKLAFLEDELAALKQKGLYRPLRVLASPQGAEVVIQGRRA